VTGLCAVATSIQSVLGSNFSGGLGIEGNEMIKVNGVWVNNICYADAVLIADNIWLT